MFPSQIWKARLPTQTGVVLINYSLSVGKLGFKQKIIIALFSFTLIKIDASVTVYGAINNKFALVLKR